ncbi:5'-3' exoribonuclease 1-like isoform X2 [Varroa destructor]|uniref:5'-3' exoribonuclease 1 n=1 Tax=Varroa destructor TaxID=109461 RepID=A0A7M7MI09_VARDE|nr:5'-3' exoribonuclease 1-like isoform X2 [Varroa destructor]
MTLPDFDNLYLDMNGIIHLCSHPNDTDAHFRISEEEIFKNIFDYIDFIFRMVKPRKCFFMAIDGVAPRAKMNQQRDRRFRAAKEAEEMEKEAKEKGEILPTESRFDSNCISPGTEFMERLHDKLKYFVVKKLSEDAVWQVEGLKVYLSGHNAPGEGEHKAMDFIRYVRSQEGYDPNTRHCIYGQDADLIMLALCTHEPHIALLREEVVFGKRTEKRIQSADKVTFHILHISLLREYLDHEFAQLKEPGILKQGYNLENIIDDWLLMCFLVGNDFLPHLPNLHIAHDALPILHQTYCDVMPDLDGYLHDRGQLNLRNFEVFMRKLGERDIELFKNQKTGQRYLKGKVSKETLDAVRTKFPNLDIPVSDSDELSSDDTSQEEFLQHKRHYYMTKMGYSEVTEKELREQTECYIRAVQWNLHYYYNGVQSWSWYYPYHYSPYISDIKDFGDLKLGFEMGKPFLPFQQLVSIMPAASSALVPQAYRGLMLNPDSPLREYFPDTFETDLNGKTQQWEAVVLIKYIEEDILLNSMAAYDNRLSEREKSRNQHGPHMLFEYSPKRQKSFPSPKHKCFPHIKISHAKCTEVPNDTFRIQKHTIKKGRLANTKDSLYFPGFPSLRYIQHKTRLVKEGCTVFQQPSRDYNMIIDVTNHSTDITRYAKLVGKIVHIDYPHLRQALVTKISDGKTVYSAEGKSLLSETEEKDCARKVENLQSKLRIRWGIDTGEGNQKLLITCKPLVGRKYIYKNDDQVTIERQWAEQEKIVLHSTMVCGLREHEQEVAQFQTISDVFVKDKLVFLLSPNEYGMKGTICGYQKGGYLVVESRFREEPDFTEIRKREPKLRKRNYLPAFRLARELGLDSHLVARLTGCIQIQLNSTEADSSQHVNIGMNLKFNKKNEEVVGFSKKVTTQEGKTEWRFSQDTVAALRELIMTFGDFYLALKQFIGMDKIPLEKCFPGESYKDGLNKAREIAKWIKDQPFSKAPHQTSGAIVFDEGVIEAIQQCVDEHLKSPEIEQTVKVHVTDVYLPNVCVNLFVPDKRAYFCMYDRVVNVRPDIAVPLGLKGTVIGIHRGEQEDEREATYEVLFDKEFATGIQSHGVKGRRVATLSVVSLINITHGQRMLDESQKSEMLRREHGAYQAGNPITGRAKQQQTPQQKQQQSKQQYQQNVQSDLRKSKNVAEEKSNSRPLQKDHSRNRLAQSTGLISGSKQEGSPAVRAKKNVGSSGKFETAFPDPVGMETSSTDNIITFLFNSISGVKASLGQNPNPVSLSTAPTLVRPMAVEATLSTKTENSGNASNYTQGIPITVTQLFGLSQTGQLTETEAETKQEHHNISAKMKQKYGDFSMQQATPSKSVSNARQPSANYFNQQGQQLQQRQQHQKQQHWDQGHTAHGLPVNLIPGAWKENQLKEVYGYQKYQRGLQKDLNEPHYHPQQTSRKNHTDQCQKNKSPHHQQSKRQDQHEDHCKDPSHNRQQRASAAQANKGSFAFIPSQVMMAEAKGRTAAQKGAAKAASTQGGGETKHSDPMRHDKTPTLHTTDQRQRSENVSSSAGRSAAGPSAGPPRTGTSVEAKVNRTLRGRRMGAKFGDAEVNQ